MALIFRYICENIKIANNEISSAANETWYGENEILKKSDILKFESTIQIMITMASLDVVIGELEFFIWKLRYVICFDVSVNFYIWFLL